MATIGPITIPDYSPALVFPLPLDYGYGIQQQPQIVSHDFSTANRKIHQRFVLGNGSRKITVGMAGMSDQDRETLVSFWESLGGAWKPFFINDPTTGEQITVCFADPTLTVDAVIQGISAYTLTLAVIPSEVPEYAVSERATRMPTAALTDGLLDQTQVLIPLVKISAAGSDPIYVADRYVRIGGLEYQPRLLDWGGIGQTLGDQGADEARFTLGNADRVFSQLVNAVDLYKARLQFSLYHAGSGVLLDLWAGDIVNWESADGSPEFVVSASDGLWEMKLGYPERKILRNCWKTPGVTCPLAAGTLCDRTWDACQAHGKQDYFGGVLSNPTSVTTKDNSTGRWGIGRDTLTSRTLISDSIYGLPLQEVYTEPSYKAVQQERSYQPDDPDNPNPGEFTTITETVYQTADLPVECLLAAGRDEGDFYSGLGIVGRGPIKSFGDGHTLDGQPHHGPGNYGLRLSVGDDPNPDYFNINDASQPDSMSERAAGVAFAEIRRTDEKGLQLSPVGQHAMKAMVRYGLSGWAWTAPGERQSVTLTNPVWIAVNMLLRAKRVWYADAATQEQYFDVDAAVQAAALCDMSVPKIVSDGGGITTEKQYVFRGVLKEEKPLRDWMTEVLNTCLGYYLFRNGKLKIGLRADSGAKSAFTAGNIVADTLQLAPIKPTFNSLTVQFGNANLGFIADAVPFVEQSHITAYGQELKSTINLVGVSTRSHAARFAVTRVYEELGGVNEAQWKAARTIGFRTTVLALETEPGMVCSLDHPEMPGGHGEFRIQSWKLNKDFSIDIQGRTTTDEIYTMVAGGNQFDIAPDSIPVERTYSVPDVSGITAEAPRPVVVDGAVRAKITIRCTAPQTPGSGAYAFKGVQVTTKTPVKTSVYPDQFTFAGQAGAEFTFDLYVPYPSAEESWTIYLQAKSDAYINPLALSGDGATPSVTLTVPSSPIAGQAPAVRLFRAGMFNQATGEWTPSMRWEPLKTKMLIDWGCMLPSDAINWSGVAVFIQTPGSEHVQASDLVSKDAFTETDAGAVYYGCIAVEGTDIPATPEQWTFIACSYDRSGNPNALDGAPIGPAVQLMTLTPEAKPITDSGQVNLDTAAGQIGISNIRDITAINISSLTGNLDISRVENLGTVDIGTFSGQLDVTKVKNLGTLNISSFQGNLDVSRVDNLGTVSISSFSGSLDVSRVANLNTLSVNSFQGNLDVSRVNNLNTVNINSFQGVITTDKLQNGILSDLNKFALDFRPIVKVSTLPYLPDPAYPWGTVVLRTSDSTLWKTPNGISWNSVKASDTITGKIADSDILSISATKLVGQINAGNVSSIKVSDLSGTLSAAQCGAISVSQLSGTLSAAQCASIDIQSFSGTIGTINATTVTLQGQWVDGQIKNVSASKLLAGEIDVTGAGIFFKGEAGVTIMNGGNLNINPGTIAATSASFKSVGVGWAITPGLAPAILGDANSYLQCDYVKANSFRCGEYTGLAGQFVSIQALDGKTHGFTIRGGIICDYAIT